MSDKYSSWKSKAEAHDTLHLGTNKGRVKDDLSCSICYPLLVTNRKFIRFWKWYTQIIPQVADFTSKTEEVFSEYLECMKLPSGKDRNNRVKGKIGKLLACMSYDSSPNMSEGQIRQKIIEITHLSQNFERSIERVEDFWKECT